MSEELKVITLKLEALERMIVKIPGIKKDDDQ